MNNEFDTLPEDMADFHWSIYDETQFRPSLSFDDDRVQQLQPGKTITGTPWKILRVLGRGGVGEVFEVEHEKLGRKAAFKILLEENLLRRGLTERMQYEGRLLGSLRHPNIVDAFDMGVLRDGRPYLVLELLDGRDLRAELKRLSVLSVPAVLDIATQVLMGLAELHQNKIVHRDVKLENVFLCGDGEVKILDLGAATEMGETAEQQGPSLGTPRTMAPEQYEGKPIDERTDIYALGIVLYELLTGRGPFDDIAGLEALRFAHCHRMPLAPSQIAPHFIPPEIDALVMKALAKSPMDRFGSAEAMALEIAALRTASLPAVASTIATNSSLVPFVRTTVRSLESRPKKSGSVSIFSVSIALLALVIATLALGIAVGRKAPRVDMDAVNPAVFA